VNSPTTIRKQLPSCQTWPPHEDTFPAESVDWCQHLLQAAVCNR